jgi:hypothetical protein
MPWTAEGDWIPYPSEWDGDTLIPLPRRDTEYKAVEVHPGILYVVEMETGLYDKHLAKDPIVPLPHGSKLIATFEAAFPDAASSIVMIPVDEL